MLKENFQTVGFRCKLWQPYLKWMVNMRQNVSGFPTEYKKKLVKDTNGGKQSISYISYPAVKILLSKSRKAMANVMANELGFDIDSYHCVPVETETLTFLQDVFRDETIVFQQPFGVYRVDMFFPKSTWRWNVTKNQRIIA